MNVPLMLYGVLLLLYGRTTIAVNVHCTNECITIATWTYPYCYMDVPLLLYGRTTNAINVHRDDDDIVALPMINGT